MAGNEVFRLKMAELVKNAGEKVDQAVRSIVIELERSVIERSPVGDPSNWVGWNEAMSSANSYHWLEKAGFVSDGYVGGRFRANWNVSFDAIDKSTSEEVDVTGQSSIDAGVAAMSDFKLGQTVYLTNSLPYAYRLEHGHSKQAPSGMVGLAVVELNQIISKVVSELK
jgi:hypothetical protein